MPFEQYIFGLAGEYMIHDNQGMLGSGLLPKQITRRDAIKAGGVAAVGLAFRKLLIGSIYPKPVFSAYTFPESPVTPQFWPGRTKPRALGTKFEGGNVHIHDQNPDKVSVSYDGPWTSLSPRLS